MKLDDALKRAKETGNTDGWSEARVRAYKLIEEVSRSNTCTHARTTYSHICTHTCTAHKHTQALAHAKDSEGDGRH